ncbi:hypothetical protein QYM36_018982, partial [Artemia franciscana]
MDAEPCLDVDIQSDSCDTDESGEVRRKELLCGKSELTKHAKYKKHIQNFEEWDKACRSSGKLETMVQSSYQVQETEARLVSFVVENNLSLVLVEDLVSLVKTLPLRSVLENTEDGLFYRIRQEAEELVRTFASSFMNLSYIRTFSNILELDEKNEPQYLPLRQVYLGMEAYDNMALLSCDPCVNQTELDLVYRAARDFYVEAIAQIKARFKFEDPIFEFTK